MRAQEIGTARERENYREREMVEKEIKGEEGWGKGEMQLKEQGRGRELRGEEVKECGREAWRENLRES